MVDTADLTFIYFREEGRVLRVGKLLNFLVKQGVRDFSNFLFRQVSELF